MAAAAAIARMEAWGDNLAAPAFVPPLSYLFAEAELDRPVRIPHAVQAQLGMAGLRQLGMGFAEPVTATVTDMLPMDELKSFFRPEYSVALRRFMKRPVGIAEFARVLDRARQESTPWDRLSAVAGIIASLDGTFHTEKAKGEYDKALNDLQRDYDREVDQYASLFLARLTHEAVRRWVLATLLCGWSKGMLGGDMSPDMIALTECRVRRVERLLVKLRGLGWDIQKPADVARFHVQHPDQCILMEVTGDITKWGWSDASRAPDLLDAAWERARQAEVEVNPPGPSWFDDWELRLPIHTHGDKQCGLVATFAASVAMQWMHEAAETMQQIATTCNTLDKLRMMKETLAVNVQAVHELCARLRPYGKDPRERLLLLALCLPVSAITKFNGINEAYVDQYFSIVELRVQRAVFNLLQSDNPELDERGFGYPIVTYTEIRKFCDSREVRRMFIALGLTPPANYPAALEQAVRTGWTKAAERRSKQHSGPLALTLAKPQRDHEVYAARGLKVNDALRGTLPFDWAAEVATYMGGGSAQLYRNALQHTYDHLRATQLRWADLKAARALAEEARAAEREQAEVPRDARRKRSKGAAVAAPAAPVAAAAAAMPSAEEMDLGRKSRRLRSRV